VPNYSRGGHFPVPHDWSAGDVLPPRAMNSLFNAWWTAFLDDPDWHATVAKTEKESQLLQNISNQIPSPMNFSLMK
jgi:hypothetical protein